MARGALHWSVEELARESELAKNTVLAFELGRTVRDVSMRQIQAAFEAHGISFSLTAKGMTVTLAA